MPRITSFEYSQYIRNIQKHTCTKCHCLNMTLVTKHIFELTSSKQKLREVVSLPLVSRMVCCPFGLPWRDIPASSLHPGFWVVIQSPRRILRQSSR